MGRKIILDCDPGHDDAVALILAHGNPDIELVAVTTVAGNQTLEKVTRNALSVATVLGMAGVSIAAGVVILAAALAASFLIPRPSDDEAAAARPKGRSRG